jgi:hypothetical protein
LEENGMGIATWNFVIMDLSFGGLYRLLVRKIVRNVPLKLFTFLPVTTTLESVS